MTIRSRVGLQVGANTTDRIEVSNPANFATQTIMTALMFVIPRSVTAGRIFLRKGVTGVNFTTAGTAGDLNVGIARSGAGVAYNTIGNAPLATLGIPYAIAFTYDLTHTTPDLVKFYVSPLKRPLVRIPATGSSTDGSGTMTNDSGTNLAFGGRPLGAGSVNDAILGLVAMWPGVELSLDDLRDVQSDLWHDPWRSPRGAGLYLPFGAEGTRTQWDRSGNKNNGTVTGATLARGLPRMFRSPQRIGRFASVAATTFSYTGTGGMTTAGAAGIKRVIAVASAGGLVTGGAATVKRVIAVRSSGGLVTGGAADVKRVIAIQGSGGLTLGGSAGVKNVLVIRSAGGLTLDGSALVKRVIVVRGSGGITLGGTATVSSGSGVSVIFSFVGSGGITLGGTAPWRFRLGYIRFHGPVPPDYHARDLGVPAIATPRVLGTPAVATVVARGPGAAPSYQGTIRSNTGVLLPPEEE